MVPFQLVEAAGSRRVRCRSSCTRAISSRTTVTSAAVEPFGSEMIAGSALLLIHHAAHMIWLIRPEPSRAYPWSVVLALGLFLGWGALFAAALRTRPHDEAD